MPVHVHGSVHVHVPGVCVCVSTCRMYLYIYIYRTIGINHKLCNLVCIDRPAFQGTGESHPCRSFGGRLCI